MSTTTPPAPWEEPTMELRQVMGTVDAYVLMADGRNLRPTKTLVVMGVQQKWLVQDGETYSSWQAPRAPTDHLIQAAYGEQANWYTPVRAEWRDLPQIGVGEAEIVLR